MKNLLFSLFLGVFVFSSCGDHDHDQTSSQDGEKAEMKKDAAPSAAPSMRLSPFGVTQDYPDAKLMSMDYKGGEFVFGVKDYELATQTPDAKSLMCANSDKGQHIHLIVDNEPYFAKYTSTFEQKLEDGNHTILAFLSRSYHESVKVPTASIVKNVVVKDGAFEKTEDVKEPMLFYSRPKGTYVGEGTKKLLLDFYPYNVTLGEDYKVKVVVNETEIAIVDKWQPYALEGLPMGDNTVVLTLVDKDNKRVDTPFNPVKRTFTLKPDVTEELKGK